MESLNFGNRIDKTPLKRQDDDRISNLPDSLLQHILAFVSTRDAVRTSILSRRWKNLWKLVPCLDLDTKEFADENKLVNFMDKFIILRGNSDLQKFKLKFDQSSGFEISRFKSWIDAAVICKVEHFEIEMFFLVDYEVKIPRSLLLQSTLVVLKLVDVVVDVPELVSLSSLKIMHLDKVRYADDSAFRTLISGCPVLKKLSIFRIYEDNVQVMCVCSQTLRWLSIVICRDLFGPFIIRTVIDAPHLEYLSLIDPRTEDLVMNNLGPSLEAKINVTFDTDYEPLLDADDFTKRSNIRRFFVTISNVKSLSLSSCTLMLISKYLKLETLPQFHGLIHLETEFCLYEWELLLALLACCRNLKSFVLNCWREIGKPFIIPLSPPQCLLCLESITLKTHTNTYEETAIIRYFLENAAVLKTLTIQPRRSISKDSVYLKKLLAFPRRSPACRIFVE